MSAAEAIIGKNNCRRRSKTVDAGRLYAKAKLEIREGRFFPEKRKRITVAQAIDNYLDVKASNKSHETDLWHARMMTEAFGDELVDMLGPHDIEKWMVRRAAETSNTTANKTFGFLKRICRKAVRDGLADKDPTTRVDPLREPPGRDRYLTDAEEVRLQAVMRPEDFILVEFAYLTGLRQSEQFELEWDRVDLRHKYLKLPDPKSQEVEYVHLNSRALELLKALPSRGKSPWVFPGDTAVGPERADNFTARVFRPALKKARIKDFRWHDLRHTFGSRMAMDGVPIYEIQKALRHRSTRMTERYAHLSPQKLQSAVEAVVRQSPSKTNPESQPPKQPSPRMTKKAPR